MAICVVYPVADRAASAIGHLPLEPMDRESRIKRLRFRAWHRGTKEADLLIGGFFDAHHGAWGDAEIAGFELLIEEQDVDIMAWAMGTQAAPAAYEGSILAALRTLNYVPIAR